MTTRAETPIPGGEPESVNDLEVSATCPQCGGENRWGLLQTLATCQYCESCLWWPNPEDKPEYIVTDNQVRGREGIIDLLATHDAVRERADMVVPAQGDQYDLRSHVYDLALPSLESIKRKRRRLYEVYEHHTLYVPYLLASATLAFQALGRSVQGTRKVYRNCYFLLETILPAYPEGWNFRDRGLWMSRRRVHAVTPEMLREQVFVVPRVEEINREDLVKTWIRRKSLLKPDMRPIYFESELNTLRTWIVFRPYIFAAAKTRKRSGWFLLDGQFGTIAGYPAQHEADRIVRHTPERLEPDRSRFADTRAIPFRCGICGWDVALDPRGLYQLCRNCGRVLKPSASGLSPVPYRTLSRESIPWWPQNRRVAGTAWLPFWSLRGTWRYEGRPYGNLVDLLYELIPFLARSKARMPETIDRFVCPAFESRIYDGYDFLFSRVCGELAACMGDTSDSRLILHEGLGPDDVIYPPTLEAKPFRSLVDRLLPGQLPDPARRRLNVGILKKLFDARFTVAKTELMYVPLPLVRTGGTSVRVFGPGVNENWEIFEKGTWPPAVIRSVRRWKNLGKRKKPSRHPKTPRFLPF